MGLSDKELSFAESRRTASLVTTMELAITIISTADATKEKYFTFYLKS
jgi:hypothetical protein